jgi:hypothetical protein
MPEGKIAGANVGNDYAMKGGKKGAPHVVLPVTTDEFDRGVRHACAVIAAVIRIKQMEADAINAQIKNEKDSPSVSVDLLALADQIEALPPSALAV